VNPRGHRSRGLRAAHSAPSRLPFAHWHALQVFRQLSTFAYPADLVLHRYFRAAQQLGRRDRQTLAERAYYMLRHHRRLLHDAEAAKPPAGWPAHEPWDAAAQLLRAVLAEEADAAVGATSRPSHPVAVSLGGGEHALPDPVRYSLPDWLHARLQAQHAHDHEAARALFAALLVPAALDVRVAVWHPALSGGGSQLAGGDEAAHHHGVPSAPAASGGAVARAIALLAEDGIRADACAGMPYALRIAGKPALEQARAFTSGLIEVQDAGSQVIAALLAPRRGQVVVDFCAGAGGKTLAIGAALRNTGQVFACDVSAARLARLKPRLVRAGLSNVQPIVIADERDPKLAKLVGKADAVLVDAPCSGSGTLRRNPDLKWRFTERDLGEVIALQARILRAAASLVRAGGWLVYASCSLVRAENEEQVLAFLADTPDFVAEPPGPVLDAQHIALGQGMLDPQSGLHIWRSDIVRDGCDAFFAVRMQRRHRGAGSI